MRVTKVATTRACAVCERTLLMGERAASFAPSEGAELVDVCPLCQELAVEAGWIKEGAPTTPTLEGGRRRCVMVTTRCDLIYSRFHRRC